MKCLECQERLQAYLDGVPSVAGERFEQHLIECPTCQEQQLAAQRLREGLRLFPRVTPPAPFAQAVVAGELRDRRHRQEKMRRRVYVTMALAASVLLMLGAAYWWMPPASNNDIPPKQQIVDNTKADPLPEKSVEPKENKKQEPRHALTALTERWADTTRDHAKVMLVAANLDTVNNLPTVGELPVEPSVREAGQEVSDGVRTVTRTARKAFDFFARELPMPDMPEQKN